MIARRRLLVAIGSAWSICTVGSGAQEARRRPRVGFIGGSAISASSPYFTTFRDELQRLGYFDGKNIVIDYKAAEGQLGRIPGLVQELVESKVDVIVAPNIVATRAAQRSTTTIPVVMVSSVDPVAEGFAKSLRQPGGNITGIANLRTELSAKRIELLKELFPGISRVAILWDTDGPGPRQRFQEYSSIAKPLKLSIQSLEVRGPTPDLENAFASARSNRVQALIVISNPLTIQYQSAVMALAGRHGLPLIAESRGYAAAGGLISYAADSDDEAKTLAAFVAQILKGAKPADLPIRQPTTFELSVNLKTAKALGIKIPPEIMVRANKVFE